MAPLNGAGDVEAPRDSVTSHTVDGGPNLKHDTAANETAFVDTRTGEHVDVEKVWRILSEPSQKAMPVCNWLYCGAAHPMPNSEALLPRPVNDSSVPLTAGVPRRAGGEAARAREAD